ncbi:hypothetical protein CSAL01_11090 [Colletotrichum salicis]|uniref:Uncharacterized protein n=1 Tax=Colletotrichum salicis TaxID=1209931 RepID=A0A135UJ68_9PEZI|nr:hypothetical protein CSAL01_11090 [Colletotrichum salicis]
MLLKAQPGASIWHLKLPSQQCGMLGSGRFPKRTEHKPEAMGPWGSFIYEGNSKGAEEEKQRASEMRSLTEVTNTQRAGPLQDISKNQNSPIPLHNPAIQRPRQHQAPSTKQKKHRQRNQGPRSKGALPKHPVPNRPVQFPFDPRPAVSFFYSTVPGPLFLSWAYFLSQSPSRVVSSLAAAAPRPLEPNSSRPQVEPPPLFVAVSGYLPRKPQSSPSDCTAYGYDSRPT